MRCAAHGFHQQTAEETYRADDSSTLITMNGAVSQRTVLPYRSLFSQETVQDILVDQDVPLPRNEKFHAKDPSYDEFVEEMQYGTYTDLAKAARSEAEAALKEYRQYGVHSNSGKPEEEQETLKKFRQW